MTTEKLTSILPYFKIHWSNFVVSSEEYANVEKAIELVSTSNELVLAALNFSKYKGYANNCYGEGIAPDVGITEQQAYDIWISVLRKEEKLFKRQLIDSNINTITQSQYDGLFLYFWATRKWIDVIASEGVYSLKSLILNKDFTTVASMIFRSSVNKQMCRTAATIIVLADYGSNKTRAALRAEGIYHLRNANEIGSLTTDQLKRARYVYYAETGKFLPMTPDSIKRDIAKKYEETLIKRTHMYDGETNVFDIGKEPSMYPIPKLEVLLNGNLVQNEYDYTISGKTISFIIDINQNDVIQTTINI